MSMRLGPAALPTLPFAVEESRAGVVVGSSGLEVQVEGGLVLVLGVVAGVEKSLTAVYQRDGVRLSCVLRPLPQRR
jgi:hypothetical protein